MSNDDPQSSPAEVAGTAAADLAALRRDFPGYQIWMVSVYIGPDTWHARTVADAEADITTHNIDATSAGCLREMLQQRSAGRGAGRG